MKRIVVLSMLTLMVMSAYSQKKPKIKGDREVVEISELIKESFNTLEIDDAFEVTWLPSNTARYELETDGNLLDVVTIKVIDSVLKITSTHRITKSKKLNLTLYASNIEYVVLRDNCKLQGKGQHEVPIFQLEGHAGSSFRLDVEADAIQVKLSDNSGGRIKARAGTAAFWMGNRTDLKLDVSSEKLSLHLKDNAELKVEGDADHANYELKDGAHLKAQDMKATRVVLNASNNVDVFVRASRNFELYAQGGSDIYLYGDPKVEIKGLADKARLIKKN